MAGVKNQAARTRSAAYALDKKFGVRVTATYDDRARNWNLHWPDGPTPEQMTAALRRLDRELVDGTRMLRTVQPQAVALSALRVVAAAPADEIWRMLQDPYYLQMEAEDDARRRTHPDRPDGEREAAMLARLLRAAEARDGRRYASERTVCVLLKENGGVGWLLAPDLGECQGEPDSPDGERELPTGPALSPLELLTARYAAAHSFDAGKAWQQQGQVLPLRAALDLALADPELPKDAALAAVELLGEVRAQYEALELRTLQRAKEASATLAEIGAKFGGKSRQAIHERLGRAPS